MPHHQPVTGNEALAIIDQHREWFDDRTALEPLAHEFPGFVHRFGYLGVQLLNLSDNRAGAFKWRGAIVGASRLALDGGVTITAPSAGNHARGAALAGRRLNMPTTVIVPATAPYQKKQAIRQLWPGSLLRVEPHGSHFDDSLAQALRRHDTLLHPYDDPNVIAGQGTVVDDILRLAPQTEHILVPVGGGGLLSGVLQRLDEKNRTDIVVHAMQAEGSDSLARSLGAGEQTQASRPNVRYGGSAVKQIGTYAFDICSNSNNLVVHTIPDDDVFAFAGMYEQDRSDLIRTNTPAYEPTSLVALAGLWKIAPSSRNIVVLGTGQNAPISEMH